MSPDTSCPAPPGGRRVMGELKRLEQKIVDAGVMPYA